MIFYNKKVQGTTAAETRLKLVSKKIKCYLGFTNFSFTTIQYYTIFSRTHCSKYQCKYKYPAGNI